MTEQVSLFDIPHRRARALLATGVPVFLPFDPVEYHGPHLPLNNDRLMSAAIVRAIHAGLVVGGLDGPLVVADAVPLGVEPVQGPGSRVVAFAHVRAVVVAACESLAALGAQRVVLVTSHGAPLHSAALQHGVRLLHGAGVRALAPFAVVLRDLVSPPDALFDEVAQTVPAAERAALRASLRHDFHAGFGETSLSLHWAPEAVDPAHRDLPDVQMPPPDARLARAARLARRAGREALAVELEFAAVGRAWFAMRPFPGYTGKPRLANARAGALLARFGEQRMLAATRAVLEQGAAPPEPPMGWLERATLGGRLAPSST